MVASNNHYNYQPSYLQFGSMNYGMGCYGGYGLSCEGQLGYQAASIFLNYAPMLLSGIFGCDGGGGGGTPEPTAAEKAVSTGEEIDGKIEELCEGLDINTYKDHKAENETWYTEALGKANKAKEDAEAEMKSVYPEGSGLTYEQDIQTVSGYDIDKAELERQIAAAETDPETRAALVQQQKDLKLAYENAQKRIDKYNKAQGEYEAAEAELVALDSRKTERQAEINAAIVEITGLIEDQKQYQGQANVETLDRADGLALFRSGSRRLGKLFNVGENNQITGIADGINVSIADLQGLMAEFRTTDNKELKKLWADKFIAAYESVSCKDWVQSNGSLKAGYEIIKDYRDNY